MTCPGRPRAPAFDGGARESGLGTLASPAAHPPAACRLPPRPQRLAGPGRRRCPCILPPPRHRPPPPQAAALSDIAGEVQRSPSLAWVTKSRACRRHAPRQRRHDAGEAAPAGVVRADEGRRGSRTDRPSHSRVHPGQRRRPSDAGADVLIVTRLGPLPPSGPAGPRGATAQRPTATAPPRCREPALARAFGGAHAHLYHNDGTCPP